ncbi:hypothetical protein KKP97_00575 [Methanothermococcus sp. SCGC AD-155-C09]|nr:hypothetical protein [Methanothermococcus sp. SCGC AD-155-C09]
MKNCLICTLGNRDIQFKKEYESNLKILENILHKDNDLDSNELCIKRNNFLDNTCKILENYDQIEDYITLPILQPCLDKYKKIKKIILIPTDQRNENINENHKKGDTFIAAEIIKKFLERRGYSNNIEIKAAKFDASNLEKWFNHIYEIINNNYEEFDKLIFEISGGIPTSKEAIRLASLFKNKIEVVEVVSGKVNPTNMGFFESRIIKEKVKDLIRNYNYTGALAFEGYYKEDKEVLNLINHLNYRLNFDFENALECYREERLEELMNEENTIKKLEYFILELLDNMEIELKNGNYANFLARVYRLDEAMGQYLFLRWFEKTGTKISYRLRNSPPSGLIIVANIGVDNLNEKLESYLNYLMERIKNNNIKINHKGVLELKNFIKKNYIDEKNGESCINKEKNRKSYIKLNIPTYCKLINHFYGDSSSEYKVFIKIHKMYKGDHNLRHTTIVAHGFKGTNKKKIDETLKRNGVNEDINKYFKDIRSEFFKLIKRDDINIFNKLNGKIISKF